MNRFSVLVHPGSGRDDRGGSYDGALVVHVRGRAGNGSATRGVLGSLAGTIWRAPRCSDARVRCDVTHEGRRRSRRRRVTASATQRITLEANRCRRRASSLGSAVRQRPDSFCLTPARRPRWLRAFLAQRATWKLSAPSFVNAKSWSSQLRDGQHGRGSLTHPLDGGAHLFNEVTQFLARPLCFGAQSHEVVYIPEAENGIEDVL